MSDQSITQAVLVQNPRPLSYEKSPPLRLALFNPDGTVHPFDHSGSGGESGISDFNTLIYDPSADEDFENVFTTVQSLADWLDAAPEANRIIGLKSSEFLLDRNLDLKLGTLVSLNGVGATYVSNVSGASFSNYGPLAAKFDLVFVATNDTPLFEVDENRIFVAESNVFFLATETASNGCIRIPSSVDTDYVQIVLRDRSGILLPSDLQMPIGGSSAVVVDGDLNSFVVMLDGGRARIGNNTLKGGSGCEFVKVLLGPGVIDVEEGLQQDDWDGAVVGNTLEGTAYALPYKDAKSVGQWIDDNFASSGSSEILVSGSGAPVSDGDIYSLLSGIFTEDAALSGSSDYSLSGGARLDVPNGSKTDKFYTRAYEWTWDGDLEASESSRKQLLGFRIRAEANNGIQWLMGIEQNVGGDWLLVEGTKVKDSFDRDDVGGNFGLTTKSVVVHSATGETNQEISFINTINTDAEVQFRFVFGLYENPADPGSAGDGSNLQIHSITPIFYDYSVHRAIQLTPVDPVPIVPQTILNSIALDIGPQVIIVDASSGDITITLPDIVNQGLYPVTIKRIDSSGNVVTIAPYIVEGVEKTSLNPGEYATYHLVDGNWILY